MKRRWDAMAVLRERPYAGFNFLVDLGAGDTEGPEAGFQECTGIGMEVAVIQYRNGNERENGVRKLAGLASVSDVTLRRGFIGSLQLYRWIGQVRDGDPAGLRTVTIQLVSEDHSEVVVTWKLLRARIVRFFTGPLHARGTDVAMEEITIVYERLEME
jgi:phage tail-like protein